MAQPTFREKLWRSFCKWTHLHGFPELYRYNNWWNRIYWIASIFSGIAFASILVLWGIQNFLSDPVATHTTFNNSGALDTKVMYCPINWIDRRKLAQHNDTNIEVQLFYALSFLRNPAKRYYVFGSELKSKLTIDRETILPRLSEYVRDTPIPPYYSVSAQLALKDIAKQNIVVHLQPTYPEKYMDRQCVALQSKSYCFLSKAVKEVYIALYKMMECNQEDDLFHMTYKYLLLNESDPRIRSLYNRTFSAYDDFGTEWIPCLTFEALDKLSNSNRTGEAFNAFFIQETTCTTKLLKAAVQLRNLPLCNVPEQRLQIENEISRLLRLRKFGEPFGRYHAERVFEIMKEKLTQQLNYISNSAQALVEYLNQQDDGAAELQGLLFNAEKKFFDEQEESFNKFLIKYKFSSALDFLKEVSVDMSNFLVWLSVSGTTVNVPSPDSMITAEKVMTGNGACIQFHCIDPSNRTSRFWQIRDSTNVGIKTYYCNIIELEDLNPEDSKLRPFNGQLFFGDKIHELYSLVPMVYHRVVKNRYDANVGSFKHRDPYDKIRIENILPKMKNSFLVYQGLLNYTKFQINSITNLKLKNRQGSPCRDVEISGNAPVYTYENCYLTCSNYLMKNMFIYGEATHDFVSPTNCYYMAEVLPNLKEELRLPDYAPCSVFTMMKGIWGQWSMINGSYRRITSTPDAAIYSNQSDDQMAKCIASCVQPCSQQLLSIKPIKMDVTEDEYVRIMFTVTLSYCQDIEGNARVNMGKNGLRSFSCELGIAWADNLQNNNYDVFPALCRNQNCNARIELEINTNSILYEEKFTYTSNMVFGVVGGQISLVMGASCLTFLQLFWVIIKTIYGHYFNDLYQDENLHDYENLPGGEDLKDNKCHESLKSFKLVPTSLKNKYHV